MTTTQMANPLTDGCAKKPLKHISVCIPTFRRPIFLKRLLREIAAQATDGKFTFSIVVADNDGQRSAETLVNEFGATSPISIAYCVQPQQNISLTRNVAIAAAVGDFIAFIDDDEIPDKRWLLTLYNAWERYGVDGILGPVDSHFDEAPPKWVLKGKFYERRTYPTGFVIDWTKGRTGNVLLKKEIFEGLDQPFDPNFHRAGDQDFFRRMIEKGHVFIWCDEAKAYEIVPPERWSRKFMLKRALLRGTIGVQHPKARLRRVLKALIAVPVYTVALPFTLLLGHHVFMNVLIRDVDHLSGLLAAFGIKTVKSQLVTD
jgi:succinoglycan biosynthesis protein ExoM